MQTPDELRRLLDQVLSEPRFEAPQEGLWDRIVARALATLARWITIAIEAVGGPVIAGLIALVVVAAIVLFVAVRLAGRRAATITERIELARLLEVGADPDEFLRRAKDASAAGDHAEAIRMRFIGGVLDLGRRGRIAYAPGLTTGGIVEQVGDPDFAQLAEQFDGIAYGAHPAGADDDAWSSEQWQRMRSTT